GGTGCFPGTFSVGSRFRVGIPWFLCNFGGSARLDDARLLVAHSVCKRVSGLWWRRRRCSILGPCRRVCGRCGPGEVVCTVGLHRGPSGAALAAAQAHAGLLISTSTTLSAPITSSAFVRSSVLPRIYSKDIPGVSVIFPPPHFRLNSIFLPGTDGRYGQNAFAT